MTYAFLTLMTAQVFILPFIREMYTMKHVIRFDVEFGQQVCASEQERGGVCAVLTHFVFSLARALAQVQMILVGITFFFAVFNFASSQDQGYADDKTVMTRERDRGILHLTAVWAAYSFLLSAIVTEYASASFSSWFPHMTAMTQSVRGALRTRQQTRVAPIIRWVFMVIIAFCFITPLTGIYLYVCERSGSK
jgi:hypothetical protein